MSRKSHLLGVVAGLVLAAPFSADAEESISRWPQFRVPPREGYDLSYSKREVEQGLDRSLFLKGYNRSGTPAIPIYVQHMEGFLATPEKGILPWLQKASIFSQGEKMGNLLVRSQVELKVYYEGNLRNRGIVKTIGISFADGKDRKNGRTRKVTIEVPADLTPAEAAKRFPAIERVVKSLVLLDESDPASQARLREVLDEFEVKDCELFDSEKCRTLLRSLGIVAGDGVKVDIALACPDGTGVISVRNGKDSPIPMYVVREVPRPRKADDVRPRLGKITQGPFKGNDLCSEIDYRIFNLWMDEFNGKWVKLSGISMEGDPRRRNEEIMRFCESGRQASVQGMGKLMAELRAILSSVPASVKPVVQQLFDEGRAGMERAKKMCGGKDDNWLAAVLSVHSIQKLAPTIMNESCDALSGGASLKDVWKLSTLGNSSLHWFVSDSQTQEFSGGVIDCVEGSADYDGCMAKRFAAAAYIEYQERAELGKAVVGKKGCFIASVDTKGGFPPKISVKQVSASTYGECIGFNPG